MTRYSFLSSRSCLTPLSPPASSSGSPARGLRSAAARAFAAFNSVHLVRGSSRQTRSELEDRGVIKPARGRRVPVEAEDVGVRGRSPADRASHTRRVDLHAPPPLLCKISSCGPATPAPSLSRPGLSDLPPLRLRNIGLVTTRPSDIITLVFAKTATDRCSCPMTCAYTHRFQLTQCFSPATRPNRRYSRLPLAPPHHPSGLFLCASRAADFGGLEDAGARRVCACAFFYRVLGFPSELNIILSDCGWKVAVLCGVRTARWSPSPAPPSSAARLPVPIALAERRDSPMPRRGRCTKVLSIPAAHPPIHRTLAPLRRPAPPTFPSL
ncbi:hypothetical protein B0H17DRAFT_1275687 [Mycena rosella]|uniref:Uncharacterized protein n=1 Tax=Mycena rosella TaxID=1033263 RepID=A0AAD7C6U3_MYCRO|nr:hypothetical protein B0H17DRAFT_1275687 [Mycena rosella]